MERQMQIPLSEILKARRHGLNKSQAEIASATGLDQSHISMFEREVREPSSRQIEQLAATLGPVTIGQSYTTIHNTDDLAIAIGEVGRDVFIVDHAANYGFPDVQSSVQYCRGIVEAGAGEWWVEEYELAVKKLEEL